MLNSYGEVLMHMMGTGDKNMANKLTREQDSGLKLIGTCENCKFAIRDMSNWIVCDDSKGSVYGYTFKKHFGCINWAEAGGRGMKPTREQVLALPPGRELDYWIDKYLFGLEHKKYFGVWHRVIETGYRREVIPSYSTDWSAFGDVVQELIHGEYCLELKIKDPTTASAAIYIWNPDMRSWDELSEAYSQTIEHAGCQAALLAVLEEEK